MSDMLNRVISLGRVRLFLEPSLAIATVVVALLSTAGPSSAQVYWGDRSWGGGWGDRSWNGYWGDRNTSGGNRQQVPPRDFFPFSRRGYSRPQPAVDYSKAPPPRKTEKPPSSNILVIGDSLADWLGYGLDEFYADHPEIGVERKIRSTAGLIHSDDKSHKLDWPQVTKDTLAKGKPGAIVIMLGLNDRVSIQDQTVARTVMQRKSDPPTQAQNLESDQRIQAARSNRSESTKTARTYEFRSDGWTEVYAKYIDQMIDAAKSKSVPVIWVGLPAVRGTKASDDISYLDELFRQRAEKAGIIYVDIWDGFVDENGRYVVQGPDFEGQTRRLRTPDGIHFTKAGAVKLASYVDRDLRRILSTHPTPAATPEAQVNIPNPSVERPAVGPVLPLTREQNKGDGTLLGAGPPSTEQTDPTAAQVFTRGDPLTPPADRADNFVWPRNESGVSTSAEGSSDAVTPVPSAARKDTVIGDAKKQSASKSSVKKKVLLDLVTGKGRRAHQ